MALGQPSVSFFKKVKKLAVDFVWSGSRSKIRYSKLIQNYHMGGLKLCDVETKYHSLKVVWVKKVLAANPNSFWVKLSSYFFPIKSQLIWQCNLSTKDVEKLSICDSLWSDILHSWCKFNFHEPNEYLQVLDQSVWCNTHLKQNKCTIINQNLINQGVMCLRDLFCEENNRFWTFQEITQNMNIQIDFLTHASLIDTIPQRWKNILQNMTFNHTAFISNTQKVMQIPIVTKYVYEKLLPNDKHDPLNLYWQRELRTDIPIAMWEKICYESPRVALEVKYRYFQYRLLQKKLVLNVLMNKWDPTISPLCTFCNLSAETTLHFFCECSIVIKFWKALFKWIKYTCGVVINWTNNDFIYQDILFNNIPGKEGWFANNIILMAKQYLYRVRCFHKRPRVIEFVAILHKNERAEYLLAIKKGKLRKHTKKWLNLYKAF